MVEMAIVMGAAFAAVASLIGLVAFLVAGRKDPVTARVEQLSHEPRSSSSSAAVAAFPGAFQRPISAPVMASEEKPRSTLADRIVQAGLYKRNSVTFYVVFKVVMFVAPIIAGFVAAQLGAVTLWQGLLIGLIAGGFGTLAPSFWLDSQKKARQTMIRRSLPDALDVIIICVEAGLSLPSAFVRVSKELQSAHPLLATELTIVQREIQLGASTGEALRKFGDRFDLEELRSLASVVLQAEKFGASIVQALRVNADSLRVKRMQRAEELAQKASVKILFPTLLCIFPALFVVLLGPAAYRIIALFKQLGI